ncbi:MAG: hypothetical protein JO142_12815 [Burkholderiales bacterium]|nr:hypothetical protein [Burkholderiales bacterium]
MTSVLLAVLPLAAWADAASDCSAAAGSYLTGVVTSGPTFQNGKPLHGVALTHTHIKLLADQDKQSYDVAMDNVFAAGYDQAKHGVPAPLNTIAKGDHLSLCGQKYSDPGQIGIHWVHTNCGDTPSPQKPNGWVKKISADGSVGDNLEGSTEYCKLWS